MTKVLNKAREIYEVGNKCINLHILVKKNLRGKANVEVIKAMEV